MNAEEKFTEIMNQLYKTGEYVLISDCEAYDKKYGLEKDANMRMVARKMAGGDPRADYMCMDNNESVVGIYKFDVPFLGDKVTMENTIKSFEENHSDLKVNYIYTGPSELNTKKKTHILLYVFTEKR